MDSLFDRLNETGRMVLMVPKSALTNDEKISLRNDRGLLVGQTHDHFLVDSDRSTDEQAEPAPLPPTKPTDPNSPEALLNPSNPEGQYRSPDEPVSRPELDAMTVAQLKDYATAHEIDLSGKKTKADMAAHIREQEVDAHDDQTPADGDSTRDVDLTSDNRSGDNQTSASDANTRRLEGEQL